MDACIRTTYALTKPEGYGSVRVDGVNHTHSRVVYAQHNNVTLESLRGLVVRHTCHNRWCVNPKHLVLGTNSDNMQDMMQAGRSKHGDGRPRALSEEQVAAIRQDFRKRIVIAAEYGVTPGTINAVKNRQGAYK